MYFLLKYNWKRKLSIFWVLKFGCPNQYFGIPSWVSISPWFFLVRGLGVFPHHPKIWLISPKICVPLNLQAGLEHEQNLSSGFEEWNCAVVITTTPQHYISVKTWAVRLNVSQAFNRIKCINFKNLNFSEFPFGLLAIFFHFWVIEAVLCFFDWFFKWCVGWFYKFIRLLIHGNNWELAPKLESDLPDIASCSRKWLVHFNARKT